MIYKTFVEIKKILVFSGLIAVLVQQALALDDEKAQAYFRSQIASLKETTNSSNPYTLLNLSSLLEAEIYFHFLLSTTQDFPEELQTLLTESQQLSLKYERKWHKNSWIRIQTPLFEKALLLAFLGEEAEVFENEPLPLNAFNILKTRFHISTEQLKNKLIVFLFDFATQSQFMRETLASYQKENLNLWENKIHLSLKLTTQQDKEFKRLTTFFREKIYKAKVFYTSLKSKLYDNLFQFHELKANIEPEMTNLHAFWKLYGTLPEAREIAQRALVNALYLNLQLVVGTTHIEGALQKHKGYNYFPSTYLEWTLSQKDVLENDISPKLKDFYSNGLATLNSEENLLTKIKFLEIQYETASALYHPGLAAGTIRKLLLLDPWIEFRPIDEKWLKR